MKLGKIQLFIEQFASAENSLQQVSCSSCNISFACQWIP